LAVKACTEAGVVIVAGAGNKYENANNFIPASYDNVICVSGLERNPKGDDNPPYTYQFWKRSIFGSVSGSNWGSVVDLIAPAENILSTTNNGAVGYKSGTSMAAPHVSGAAALWLDNHPTDSFVEVKAALIARAESAPSGGWIDDGDSIHEPLVNAETL